MFKKILIANRGEIACRIIKTARHLGIQSVAVYSAADRESLHVKAADEAYYLGEGPATESYLNIAALIKAAQRSQAQAIHPGYGFLSEHPDFAAACEQAGFVFIGPPLSALKAMASKQSAKVCLEKTSVPLIPGYHGENQEAEHLLAQAKKLGFPLLLKPALGGGGKGMRLVFSEDSFLSALEGARREAKKSFSDESIILEKYLSNPRHIEVQIMADTFGHCIHLFERDCSLQRRHQKVIEEAPALGLSDTLTRALREAAIEVASAIGYCGAGTVEFLVEPDENFYFIEMNTRLQVEHPVTEMITGLDLVAWQLKIAAKEPLPCQQSELSYQGHAIECRIYAEDPEKDFIPSIGELELLSLPSGKEIRIDSGIGKHAKISPYYDPMISKLIVWGETRDLTLARMQEALSEMVIAGIKTNLPFLQSLCAAPIFQDNKQDIHFIDAHPLVLKKPSLRWSLFMAASYDYLKLFARTSDQLSRISLGWQLNLSAFCIFKYQIENKREFLKIKPCSAQCFELDYEGEQYVLHLNLEGRQLRLDDGSETKCAWIEEKDKKLCIHFSEGSRTLTPLDDEHPILEENTTSADAEVSLIAPMPATVIAVFKQVGDLVKVGDALIVLEAMKMEHTLSASADSEVIDIFYTEGMQVQEGSVLIRLEASNKSKDHHALSSKN